jgi:hypothetical protein
MSAQMTEAASTSETPVTFFQATWCNNPENSHVQGKVLEKDRKNCEGTCAVHITLLFTPTLRTRM